MSQEQKSGNATLAAHIYTHTWSRSGDIVTALTGRSVTYVLISVNVLVSHSWNWKQLNHKFWSINQICLHAWVGEGGIRDLRSTLADLSKEPVIKCEPSEDFVREVTVFLWPISLSDSFKSLPVCGLIKHQVKNKPDSPRNIKEGTN